LHRLLQLFAFQSQIQNRWTVQQKSQNYDTESTDNNAVIRVCRKWRYFTMSRFHQSPIQCLHSVWIP